MDFLNPKSLDLFHELMVWVVSTGISGAAFLYLAFAEKNLASAISGLLLSLGLYFLLLDGRNWMLFLGVWFCFYLLYRVEWYRLIARPSWKWAPFFEKLLSVCIVGIASLSLFIAGRSLQ